MSAPEPIPSSAAPTPSTVPRLPAAARRRRRRRRTVAIMLPVVAALTVATAFGARALQGTSVADQYVTTTAQTGAISQTLSGSGTLSTVTSATAAFPAAGTVSSVTVSVGDKVEAGDVLARMEPTELEDAVTEAEATLAAARLSLEQAE